MKKVLVLSFLTLVSFLNLFAQHTIQASIRKSVVPHSVDILFRPNYDSDSGEYVNNLVISIAIDDTASEGVAPLIAGVGNFYSLSFMPAVPFSDTVAGRRIYTWTCTNDSVTNMTWKNDAAFIGLNIIFTGQDSSSLRVSMVDFSHSGGSSNPYFSVGVNLSPYSVISSNELFFSLFSEDNNGSAVEILPNGDQMVTTNMEIDVDPPI